MKKKPHKHATARLLAPRYWPSWVLLGLLRVVVLLPYGTVIGAGRRLGSLLRWLVPYRRKVAETNIALCFPELDARQRRKLLRATFQAIGTSLMEMALCWWARSRRLSSLGKVTGLNHIQDALKKGKGVILLTGHFSAFEIAGRLLVQHIPLCVSYREFRNPVFHRAMVKARERRFEKAIHRYDARGLINALRDNQVVWYAPDQDPGVKQSTFAPFFGIPAATLTTTSRLARITGAAVVPFSVRRMPGKSGYQLMIAPPLDDFPGDSPESDAGRINQLLETQIRLAPEQYYWVHRRFKTRPPGEAPLYPQKPRRLRQKRKDKG